MRRTFTAVAVTAALALAPAGAALAQDAGETDAEPTTTEGDDAGSVLDAWLAAVQDLFAQLTGGDGTDEGGEEGTGEEGTGEDEAGDDTDLLRTLVQGLLDGVEIEFMVAQAMEEAEGDAEGTEEDAELTEESEEGTEDEADEPHGHVVRLVAQCAPRGQEARGFLAGAANHGAYVSAVARGDAITLDVPTIEDGEDGPVVGESTTLDLTVTTVEDAETFCDALATIAEARALEAELAAAEDGDEVDAASARDERKADREAAKAERAAEREQRKAERDEAKAQRAAERAAAKAERRGR